MLTAPGPAGRRFLWLLSEAFATAGGIQSYNRLLLRTCGELASQTGDRSHALLLHDRPQDVDPDCSGVRVKAFAGSRTAFALAAVHDVLYFRPQVVVIGHAHFGALALALKALRPSARQIFLAFGVEVWARLPTLRRAALRYADSIACISRFTGERLCEENGLSLGRLRLLPCALDPGWTGRFGTLMPPSAGSRPPTMLTVSRLHPGDAYKGIDLVLRALPTIAERLPDVRYVVVGEGTDRGRLEAIAAANGVSSRVDFRGRLSDEALARAYCESALFVLPSTGEGFGIVFLEAAFFGRPSLAARAGGAAEVVLDGATGALIEAGNVDALAQKAIHLLSQPALLDEMGHRAHTRLHEVFEYPAFTARVQHVLSELAPRSTSA